MKINKYKRIFLVAMGYEIKNIFKPLGFLKSEDLAPYEQWVGKNCLVIDIGVTKTSAAGGAQWAIDNFETEKWINIGLCGSFNESFEYGQVLNVRECRFHDIDNRELNQNWKIGEIPGRSVVFKLGNIIGTELQDAKVITGDRFITNKNFIREILDDFHPDLVDEELSAIACVMEINGQLNKLNSFKIVSDKSDEQAASDFSKEERLFDRARKVVVNLLS
jgi:adenosylhomocysteine nucleosidase